MCAENTNAVPDFLTPIPKSAVTVNLPSNGHLYSEGHPAKTGKLQLMAFNLTEEARLVDTFGTEEIQRVIDEVLSYNIVEKFNIQSLLTADKFFLFMMLRSITYGSSYTFNWKCEHMTDKRKPCNAVNTHVVNIPQDFQIKTLTEEDKEPFEFTLPSSGKKVGIRLLRGADEAKIDAYERSIQSAQVNSGGAVMSVADTTPAFRLALHIYSVDGNAVEDSHLNALVSWISSLSALDVQTIREKIDFFTPGIDTSLYVTCESCGKRTLMDLPITYAFFRAVASNQSGANATQI